MKKVLMVLAGGFGLLILILLIAGVSLKNSYNNLVSLNQGTDSQWGRRCRMSTSGGRI